MFPIVRRWALVILMSTVIASLIGFGLGSTATRTYESRSVVLIGPLSTDTDTMRSSGAIAQTYAQLATSGSILRTVSRDTHVPFDELRSGVRVSANSATRFITVSARSHDPDTARSVAAAVTLQLIRQGKQDQTRPEGQLRLIDPASRPTAPISPRMDLIVSLAALAGLLGALTLVLLLEYLSDAAESVEKVAASSGLTTVSTVGRVRHSSGRLIVDGPSARMISQHRLIATQVELAANPLRAVLVTGATDHDGSAVLAINLAVILAGRHPSVLLVDAGAGDVTTIAGLEGQPGLSDLLLRSESSAIDTYDSDRFPVPVLPIGTESDGEGITEDRARSVIDAVAADGGIVVVHAGSAIVSSAALVWARATDAVVLGVRRFQTHRSDIVEATTNLRSVGAPLVLAALHDARAPGDERGSKGTARSATRGRHDDAADRTRPADVGHGGQGVDAGSTATGKDASTQSLTAPQGPDHVSQGAR